MMGHQTDGQESLFYGFSLEDHVPPITSCAASIVF